jgi:hypothetical protein
MCYGDPHFGSDGYYMDYIEQQMRQEIEDQQEAEEAYMREMSQRDANYQEDEVERELVEILLDEED